MEKDKLITLPLHEVPKDVNAIIRNEQLRLELQDKEKLKKYHVVYKIVREWSLLKNDTK